MHYKTRANVYIVLGGGGGVSRVGKSSGCTHLRLWYAKLRFCRYVGPSDRRQVRGGLPSLCSASFFLPVWLVSHNSVP